MSRFSEYFIRHYPTFPDDIIHGRYNEAISHYVNFYKRRVQTKRTRGYINIQQECSAALDGFSRHGSKREQDLRALVGNDKAFDAFIEYFQQRYGKNGIYRVSNKAREIRQEGNYITYLNKFLRRVVKLSSWNKEKMYEETNRYINIVIIPQWLHRIIRTIHKKLVQRRDNLGVSQYFIKQMAEYTWLTELMESEDELVKNCFLAYLLWHAARYINKKVKGKNIPTNRFTKALKKNPLALEFIDGEEQKALLKSFRLQKKFTNAELENAHEFYRSVFKNYDDTIGTIEDNAQIRGPSNHKEYMELLLYRKKIIAFINAIKAIIPSDDRHIPALDEITAHQMPFKIITPQHKKYIDKLSSFDISDKNACIKAVDRLIGIYTFCAREKYMTRREYYDGYFDSIVPTGNKEYWKRWRNKELDPFILKKELLPGKRREKCFYNFNTGKYEEYVSYIDAVQKLYPKSEYTYIFVGEMVIDRNDDEYITDNGYTLARYDINGELSDNLLEGNFVKTIDNPDYLSEYKYVYNIKESTIFYSDSELSLSLD